MMIKLADSCDIIDWTFSGGMPGDNTSPIALSEYSGVLAGIVLASLVAMLASRTTGQHRFSSIVLLLVSFNVSVVGGKLFDVLAGDQICIRSQVMGGIAATMLIAGILPIFVGLAWLLELLAGDPLLIRLMQLITYFGMCASIISGAALALRLRADVNTLHGEDAAVLPSWAIGLFASGLLLLLWISASARPRDRAGRERLLGLSIYVALCVAGVQALLCTIVLLLPRIHWEPHTADWLIYVSMAAMQLLPAAALLPLARAVPRIPAPTPALSSQETR